jgi:hypothetical protein
MLVVLLLGAPLLLVAAWGSYTSWRNSADSEDYPSTVAGYLLHLLDMVMATAGGASLTYLIGGFQSDGRDTASAVMLLIKAGTILLLAVGILLYVIRERKSARAKLTTYACMLALVAFAFTRAHFAEVAQVSEPPKKPFVSRP